MKNATIGIDLGTTFSVMAIYESDGHVRILPSSAGELLIPSVVNLRDEQKPVVGGAAVNELAFSPQYIARLFKRAMGRRDAQGNPIVQFVHPDSGKAYSPENLSSFIIRHLVDSVRSGLGAEVAGVVITVPAYFDDPARVATRHAGELAGVRVLSIINEPTAAGLAFGLDRGEEGVFAVYDFGGGTFDITILDIRRGNFKVLATDGDRDCGGADLDALILEQVIAAFAAQYGIVITPETDLSTWLDTLTKCEIAKKTLSQAEKASFMMAAQGNRLVFDLKRSDFNALIAPLIEKTRTITQRALAAANLQPKDIKDVLLVGGSTRIVAVREMLADLFGKKPRTDTKPDEAVAMGAAIFAAQKGADAHLATTDTCGRKVLRPGPRLVEVNSHGLGCLALVGAEELNCVIIPPNTTLPAEREDRFALLHESQTEARIVIAQGLHHAKPETCSIIGELVLGGLPPGPLDERIVVKYGFTSEGILTITATDLVSGKSTSDVKRDLTGLIGQGLET